MILERIRQCNDVKNIDPSEYTQLAQEIRAFLIEKVSHTGGHLASNLGVVELTIALHLVLNFPEDALVWDVGHQAYTHKILTGRKDDFDKLRTYGGMSGFPKQRESDCDSFGTGHSSTALSAALGIAQGKYLNHDNATVAAVVGDGALTGGLAFEALNNMGNLKRNIMIILNDNEMSISRNVGGLSMYLSRMRADTRYNEIKNGVAQTLTKIPGIGDNMVKGLKKAKSSIKQIFVPGMYFENMGITYLGPVDGHNIGEMITIFNEAKQLEHPVIVHVVTKKGKGYPYAERFPAKFHGVDPFDAATGRKISVKTGHTYTEIVSKKMVALGQEDSRIVAITAAMADGTGLSEFGKHFPGRFFDVGIAEEHAVTFAAGLATTGIHPFVAIYSSFLQRAYDQLIHDVCIQKLPVTLLIDRAGIVPGDGETHQGVFDLSYLSSIPNMNILAPKNDWELSEMIGFAAKADMPVAIRYPRGAAYTGLSEFTEPVLLGKSEVLYAEGELALLAVGNMVKEAEQVRTMLKAQGHQATLVNVRFVKPMDTELLDRILENHRYVVTIEENVQSGGFGEHVIDYYQQSGSNVICIPIAIPDRYVEQGDVPTLLRVNGLSPEQIVAKIIGKIGEAI
jgi:1-deoxy-D-xylulose-5-phosphate synthase